MGSRLRRRTGAVGLSVIIVLALVISAQVLPAAAQSGKSFHWTQYDYTVDILDNGDMLFEVTMGFSFDSGSFGQGYYSFDMDRLDDVRDVEVFEGLQPYIRTNDERVGSFQVSQGEQFEVLWSFPPTANAERTFTLRYRVIGGLRIYDEGDQFYWNFYAGDRAGRIDSGIITVHLPQAVPLESLQAAVDPGDIPLAQVDGRTLQAQVSGLPGYRPVVLRVQFPHGVVNAAPSGWQVQEDRQREYDENTKPTVELLILGVSILILVGGIGGVVALWYTRGRDHPVGVVAEYISEPPSDTPPGLAGALVDEKVDVQDILATIVDLGRRGVLTMEETQEPGLPGIGTKKDFVYRRLPGSHSVSDYEKALLAAVFGKSEEVRLSLLKNRFYSSIPKISAKMYEDLTEREFFRGNPDQTRSRWIAIGTVGLVLDVFLFVCFSAALSRYAGTFFCVPLGLGAPFLLLVIIGSAMPSKTEKGANEAAGWEAFKRYLQDIDRFEDLQERADIFEKYLPYAIALGVEKDFLNKFSQVQAPAPTWYQPYQPVIIPRPYAGPTTPTSTTTMGGTPISNMPAGGGMSMPSLQGMSDGMSASIQSMSNGLQSMLNSAANTMTSQPRSTGGGGGGGGWSGGGGGFSGGGGGGGGSGAR